MFSSPGELLTGIERTRRWSPVVGCTEAGCGELGASLFVAGEKVMSGEPTLGEGRT